MNGTVSALPSDRSPIVREIISFVHENAQNERYLILILHKVSTAYYFTGAGWIRDPTF